MSFKKIILFSLKLGFSAFCIFYLIQKFGHEFSTLKYSLKINWFYIMAALAFLGVSQVLSIIRWQICCKALGILRHNLKIDLYLGKLYLIGLFCNNFLPGSFGGDFIRAYLLKKNYLHSRWIDCAGSVLLDRAFGVTTLAWIGFMALYFNKKMNIGLTYGMGLLAIGCTLSIFAGIYLGHFFKKSLALEEASNKNLFETLKFKFIEFCLVLNKIQTYNKLAIFNLFAISAVVQVLINFCLIYLCFAFHFGFKAQEVWIMNPLATLGSLFAPSLSGLGVREGIYAYIFKTLNYPASMGIILSLSWLASLLIISSPGAFYMLSYKKVLEQKDLTISEEKVSIPALAPQKETSRL